MPSPLRSMTGAGTFALDTDHGRFEADARSVNHRFLKTSVRLYGGLPALDARVESKTKKRIERGHVSIYIRFTPAPGSALEQRIDADAFAAAAERLKALAKQAGVKKPTVADVLAAPGVLGDARSSYDNETLDPLFDQVVDGVLDALIASRETEGELLRVEIDGLLDHIAVAGTTIAARAAEVPGLLQEKIQKRLDALLAEKDVALDPEVLAREVALLADKADVTEEVARLEAHVTHARELVAEGGAIGRRLDFLVQELHRETNTVSSKASDLEMTRLAMGLKSDVERLREQVANLE